MAAMSEDRVVFLLDLEKKQLFPFSTAGFNRSNKSEARILGEYRNVAFLDENGLVTKIANVETARKGILGQLRVAVGLPSDIRVQFEEAIIPLARLKAEIVAGMAFYLRSMPQPDDSWTITSMPLPQIGTSIFAASSTKDIYSALKPPPIADCLDIL